MSLTFLTNYSKKGVRRRRISKCSAIWGVLSDKISQEESKHIRPFLHLNQKFPDLFGPLPLPQTDCPQKHWGWILELPSVFRVGHCIIHKSLEGYKRCPCTKSTASPQFIKSKRPSTRQWKVSWIEKRVQLS